MNQNAFRIYCLRQGVSLKDVANHIDVDYATLSRKLNGKSDFYRHEMQAIREFLNLTADEADEIFFRQELT